MNNRLLLESGSIRKINGLWDKIKGVFSIDGVMLNGSTILCPDDEFREAWKKLKKFTKEHQGKRYNIYFEVEQND